MTNKYFNQFLVASLVLLSVAFSAHYFVLLQMDTSFTLSQLVINYSVNLLLAVSIFLIIIRVHKVNADIIGYVFLFGSMFKFLIYFVALKPLLIEDGAVEKAKFFFFFLPYLLCLILEVIYLIKMLNNQPKAT
jgi:hypothetical protein